MAFKLPALPYAFDALEPHVDARTIEIHHGKHHAAYVANLNKALDGHADLAGKSIEQIMGDLAGVPESIRTADQMTHPSVRFESEPRKCRQPGRQQLSASAAPATCWMWPGDYRTGVCRLLVWRRWILRKIGRGTPKL